MNDCTLHVAPQMTPRIEDERYEPDAELFDVVDLSGGLPDDELVVE